VLPIAFIDSPAIPDNHPTPAIHVGIAPAAIVAGGTANNIQVKGNAISIEVMPPFTIDQVTSFP